MLQHSDCSTRTCTASPFDQKTDAACWTAPIVSDGFRLRQLEAELDSERCLNQLGQGLNACVSAVLTADQTVAVSYVVPLSQILVDVLSAAQGVAWAAVLLADDRHDPTEADRSATVVVRAVASESAGVERSDALLGAISPTPLAVGQPFTARQIADWQAQCPSCLWPIEVGAALVGWLWLAPTVDPSERLDAECAAYNDCLRSRLVAQSLDRYVTTLHQIKLIQQQMQQQMALTSRNRELAQTNQLKSEFLANTSHEIRTPLSSILGFTHLMREQGFSPNNLRHQEYLNIILSSGQHLLALINDILDLSKIEANQLDLHWEPVAVKAVCQTAMTLVREKANDKGLALKLEIAPDVESFVADALRLKQMLFNLLSNALKFTSTGSVGLQVTAIENRLRFSVWDTGTGISDEQQRLLFRPYSQIANAAAGRDEGTGLGLALTQKLAELHGGWVEVSSGLGWGSRFTVVLPLVPIAPTDSNSPADRPVQTHSAQLPPRSPANSSDALAPGAIALIHPESMAHGDSYPLNTRKVVARSNHLLLVEDNIYNAKLMLTYLGKLGYELTWVKDGVEMRQALARSRPALILMDIHLPGEDGLALTQQLKADARYQSIPIIAQTAMAMTGDRALCIEAGTVEYISKPIDLKTLAQLIGRYVEGLKD